MFSTVKIWAQSSFGLTGYWYPGQGLNSLMNSFESNPSNFISIKDWGLTLSYGDEFANASTSNLYLFEPETAIRIR